MQYSNIYCPIRQSYQRVLDFAVSEGNDITYYFLKRYRLLNFSLETNMSTEKSTKHRLRFFHWILRPQHLGEKSLIGWLEMLPLI